MANNLEDEESEPTEDSGEVILSSYVGYNRDVFRRIIDLHVKDGATIADVTYGRGNFWTDVPENQYEVLRTDIDPDKSPDSEEGVDCRELPYADNELDCVVLDPPYAEGFFRRNEDHLAGNGSHAKFRSNYSTGDVHTGGSKYHQAVLDLYFAAGTEAQRVLKDEGVFIVKVGDEVSSNTQYLTHIQITNYYERVLDFYTKDLFVVERHNTPSVSGLQNQVHARKNHSFFMVYNMDGEPQNLVESD
jgi:tRNA G10  N-methylase Trm11